MRDRAASGPFKTTGTEQWPIRMCQWVAAVLLDTCTATATTANEGQDAEKPEESYPIRKPDGPRLQGGDYCETLSRYKDFHDGGGLCSPGDGEEKLGS